MVQSLSHKFQASQWLTQRLNCLAISSSTVDCLDAVYQPQQRIVSKLAHKVEVEGHQMKVIIFNSCIPIATFGTVVYDISAINWLDSSKLLIEVS